MSHGSVRSLARIDRYDLLRLVGLAAEVEAGLFARNPEGAGRYAGRLLCRALCQGGPSLRGRKERHLRALTAAMRAVLGCSKTYVALFAESEGFEHVHFHVVPRSPDMDPGLRGPRVFGHLGGDPAGHVPAQVMDQVAASIGQSSAAGLLTALGCPILPRLVQAACHPPPPRRRNPPGSADDSNSPKPMVIHAGRSRV